MLLDRFGKELPGPPEVRCALGFLDRQLPNREGGEVLGGVAPEGQSVPMVLDETCGPITAAGSRPARG